MKNNWFLYTPPILSICLLFISGVAATYFKHKLADFVGQKRRLKDYQDVIEFIALDWSTRLTFFNSMFAALISPFSIFSGSMDYVALAITLISLLFIFFLMGWWIHGHAIGDLTSVVSRPFHIKHSTLCRYILYIVNIALIIAIYYGQNHSSNHLPAALPH